MARIDFVFRLVATSELRAFTKNDVWIYAQYISFIEVSTCRADSVLEIPSCSWVLIRSYSWHHNTSSLIEFSFMIRRAHYHRETKKQEDRKPHNTAPNNTTIQRLYEDHAWTLLPSLYLHTLFPINIHTSKSTYKYLWLSYICLYARRRNWLKATE